MKCDTELYTKVAQFYSNLETGIKLPMHWFNLQSFQYSSFIDHN